MNKITIPIASILVEELKKSKNETIVLLASFSRNGFEIGCCSDEIIKNNTGLSHDVIQDTYKNLIEKNRFQKDIQSRLMRFGQVIASDILIKELSVYISVNQEKFNQDFYGVIQKLNKSQGTLFLECIDQSYRVLCNNPNSLVFSLSVGSSIKFKGCLLEQNKDEVTIWMDEHNVESCEI